MLINYDKILNQIETINKDNELLYLKILSKTIYNKILKVINNTIKDTYSIIKGSRSIYNTLKKKLITEEEYIYKDFDLYCLDEDEFYNILLEHLEEIDLGHILTKNANPVYSDMTIISLYNQKFIDLQVINQKKYDIIPKITINNINYVKPDFMKIDIYNVFATPILFNIPLISKFANRIKHIESEYKYKYDYKLFDKIPNNINIKKIKQFKTKYIITGFLAYKLLYNVKINIPYLEIFSSNPKVEIDNIKSQIDINKIEIVHGIDYSIEQYTILYHNDQPLIYIYRLMDCKSYIIKKNDLIASNNFLLYYFNTCIYINKYYDNLEHRKIYNISDIIYTSLLSKLYNKYTTNIIPRCIGDIQPVINRSKQLRQKLMKVKTIII